MINLKPTHTHLLGDLYKVLPLDLFVVDYDVYLLQS